MVCIIFFPLVTNNHITRIKDTAVAKTLPGPLKPEHNVQGATSVHVNSCLCVTTCELLGKRENGSFIYF